MARILKGSHSFTCIPCIHPLTEWTIPAFAFPAEAGTGKVGHSHMFRLLGLPVVFPFISHIEMWCRIVYVYVIGAMKECGGRCHHGVTIRQVLLFSNTIQVRTVSMDLTPRGGRVTPLPPLSIYFLIFSPFYLFLSFIGHWLYLFSSFVHPFPIYQNSPTPFPGRRS